MQIERVQKDGTVIFEDGSMVLADVILHCTGYAAICLISNPCSSLNLQLLLHIFQIQVSSTFS